MCLIFALTAHAAAQTLADRTHPVGIPFSTTIEFGDEYTTPPQLYDVKITVTQVVRGERAWASVKQASASNQPPKAGFEYLLARIRFDYSARSAPGKYNYVVNQDQFTAMSADGREYAPTVLTECPKPALNATLAPGQLAEGWVVFSVPKDEPRPLMAFREEVGTVLRRGAGSFFQLYDSRQPKGQTSSIPDCHSGRSGESAVLPAQAEQQIPPLRFAHRRNNKQVGTGLQGARGVS